MAWTEFYVTKGASASDLNGGGPRLAADDGPTRTNTNCTGSGTTITNDAADGWGDTAIDDFLCWDTAGVKEIRRVTAVGPGAAADYVVASAGTAGANGNYNESGTYNGKAAYVNATSGYWMFWSSGSAAWAIDPTKNDPGGPPWGYLYWNGAADPTPPVGTWSIGDGDAPAAVVSQPLTAQQVSVDTAVTGGAAKTTRVCGAWATCAKGFAASNRQNAAGDLTRINYKYNATAWAEKITATGAGTAAAPILDEGYETTPGDGCPTGNYPKIDSTAQGTVSVLATTAGAMYRRTRYFHFYSTAAMSYGVSIASVRYTLERNKVETPSCTDSAIYTGAQAGVIVTRNMVISSGKVGIKVAAGSTQECSHNVIKATGGSSASYGIYFLGSGGGSIQGNIVKSAYDDCLYIWNSNGLGPMVLDNVFRNSTTGSGISCPNSGAFSLRVMGNIFSGCNQYDIEIASGDIGRVNTGGQVTDYNFHHNPGVGQRNYGWAGANEVTLSADPFTDAANDDFTLNDTAGGGTAVRSAGFPGTMPNNNVGYMDGGPLQVAGGGGGGGGLLVHPGTSGGARG